MVTCDLVFLKNMETFAFLFQEKDFCTIHEKCALINIFDTRDKNLLLKTYLPMLVTLGLSLGLRTKPHGSPWTWTHVKIGASGST